MPKTPSYRQRPGYTQAIVTLTDSASGKRRDYWLGEHGSPASREAYHRLIADWEAGGRRLPESVPGAARDGGGARTASVLTVEDLIAQYWRWAKEYYSGSCASGVRVALRVLRECYGSTPAREFGPNALRVVRDAMVAGRERGDRPRAAWSRKTANTRVGHIVRMFRWAASREAVGASVYQALQTLPALKRGRSAARESEPVGPVPIHAVEAMIPLVSRQVAALIRLQLLTGARPGELLQIRARDIDVAPSEGPRGAGVWAYRPATHKNAHRGHSWTILLGPAAQEVLGPFLADRPLDACLFSPRDAERERLAELHRRRRTPLSCGNRPGSARVESPAHQPGDHYTTASYRRAIQRACDEAFPPPDRLQPRVLEGGRLETAEQFKARLTPKERAELKAWREKHRWHPHQLRHTAATRIRQEFGLEAAQLVLGHASAAITDAVYAERDLTKVAEVIRRVG